MRWRPGVRHDLATLGCIAILIAALPTLSSCAKNVELGQEVQLPESGRKVTLKRTEIFKPRPSEFSLKQRYAQSELSIVGSDLPTWKQRAHPIYLGELRENAGYVLVAVVPEALECAAKHRPASPYLVYAAAKEHWHEIPMPDYLNGRTANLALIVEDFPLENERIVKKIDLAAKYGC